MFLDANVIVYAVGHPSEKQAHALGLLGACPVLSSQAITETMNVLLRKQKTPPEAVNEIALALLDLCRVVPVAESTVRKAIELRGRFTFSHWDSLIVAAALEAGCKTLYSEDLQHDQKIEDLRIVNPFS